MKNQLLSCIGILGCALSIQAATIPPCGTDTLRSDIQNNMETAMGLIDAATANMVDPCPSVLFGCPTEDLEDLIANITEAQYYFNLTYGNYSQFLSSSIPVDCSDVSIKNCTCYDLLGTLTSMQLTYESSYSPRWLEFTGASPSIELCSIIGNDLKNYVKNFICTCGVLLKAMERCPSTCSPCANQTFIGTLTTMYLDAGGLLGQSKPVFLKLCTNQPISYNETEAAISALDQAIQIWDLTVSNYTAYLNETEFYPGPCPSAEFACGCQKIIEIFHELFDNTVYTDKLNEFSTDPIHPCNDLARELRFLASNYSCYYHQLVEIIKTCITPTGPCVVDPYLTSIPQDMSQAMTLIANVVDVFPSPCNSRTSFCSPLLDLNATRNDLLQASQLFALVFANYTAIINDNQALTCNALTPTCSCRIIGDQLSYLSTSYDGDYVPKWSTFSTVNQTLSDCEAEAKYLRDLVNQYYCIAEDLYRDFGQCQVNCNTDWCSVYNCSSRPCPPNPQAGASNKITSEPTAIPLVYFRGLRRSRLGN